MDNPNRTNNLKDEIDVAHINGVIVLQQRAHASQFGVWCFSLGTKSSTTKPRKKTIDAPRIQENGKPNGHN
eukprot:613858-Amphidinium_carterae.1